MTSSDGLLAILLCTRTRSGARIAYSSLKLSLEGVRSLHGTAGHHGDLDVKHTGQESKGQSSLKDGLQQFDTTLGLKTEVLEKLLCPGRWSENKRFEITVDDVLFIGQPCFALPDGSWKAAPDDLPTTDPTPKATTGDHDFVERPVLQRDFTHFADSFDSRTSGTSLATSMSSVSTKSGTITDALQMFNLVFAYDVTSKGHEIDVGLIYQELCQPLTRALRHLQGHNHYVENQCRKIALLRQKASINTSAQTLEHEIELVWAIDEIYRRISAKEIASVYLNGMPISVQIHDSELPTPLPPASLNLAILLLEDKARILRSLDGHTEAAPLSYFITHLLPTKPLSKLATKLALPPEAILFLAEHLVRWRKARLIKPLHARNTYVISQTAPLERLSELAEQYRSNFLTLPTLYEMLNMLGSSIPAPYGICFPSRAYRHRYMEILAWLIREDMAVRMNTNGWLLLKSATGPGSDEDDTGTDDTCSTVSDSGTAFQPDAQTVMPFRSRLLDPTIMSANDRRAVMAIRHSLRDQEMQDIFTRLLKYFDGHQPLEDMAVMEGMKRSKVEECLDQLVDMGCLQKFAQM